MATARVHVGVRAALSMHRPGGGDASGLRWR